MPVIRLLKDPDQGIRDEACDTLGRLKDRRAVKPLIECFKSKASDWNPKVRRSAALALGEIGDKRAFETLVQGLNLKAGVNVDKACLEALAGLKDDRAIKYYQDYLKHGGFDGMLAVKCLTKIGSRKTIPLLMQALKGDRGHMRRKAWEAISEIQNGFSFSEVEKKKLELARNYFVSLGMEKKALLLMTLKSLPEMLAQLPTSLSDKKQRRQKTFLINLRNQAKERYITEVNDIMVARLKRSLKV